MAKTEFNCECGRDTMSLSFKCPNPDCNKQYVTMKITKGHIEGNELPNLVNTQAFFPSDGRLFEIKNRTSEKGYPCKRFETQKERIKVDDPSFFTDNEIQVHDTLVIEIVEPLKSYRLAQILRPIYS